MFRTLMKLQQEADEVFETLLSKFQDRSVQSWHFLDAGEALEDIGNQINMMDPDTRARGASRTRR